MRKNKLETAETRRAIVSAAAHRFRSNGLAESAISDVMSHAGLTHGGFYRHFDAKDQVIAEAIEHSAVMLVESMKAKADCDPSNGLQSVLARYLSTRHRDAPEEGCPLAAIGPEISRSDRSVRHAATTGYQRLAGLVQDYVSGPLDQAAAEAVAIVAAMVGAITLSRMVSDPELSEQILYQTSAFISHAELAKQGRGSAQPQTHPARPTFIAAP